jgi:hypothetical protein
MLIWLSRVQLEDAVKFDGKHRIGCVLLGFQYADTTHFLLEGSMGHLFDIGNWSVSWMHKAKNFSVMLILPVQLPAAGAVISAH